MGLVYLFELSEGSLLVDPYFIATRWADRISKVFHRKDNHLFGNKHFLPYLY